MLYLTVAFGIGGLIFWLLGYYQHRHVLSSRLEQINELDKNRAILSEKIDLMNSRNGQLETELSLERDHNRENELQLARSETERLNLNEKLESQKAELIKIQEKFTMEFENIAQRILKQNSLEFTLSNQKNMGDILNPLKEKIDKFEQKVSDTYEKGLKDQTDLRAELKKLYDLNHQISDEAHNLTNALKSDSKKMGNWGELILDRILEQSGLLEGREYFTQQTQRNDAGEMMRPDVIVNLPDQKHIIIDSKVSLVAYNNYVNSDIGALKDKYLKSHLESIREHVKGLGEKSYQDSRSVDSPDFVLLFMPLESAFSLAVQADPDLFGYAWTRKIVIVSPTTLLATLKTVESIWKHEKQNQNALEIARQGAALYDKFYNFVNDLEKIGSQIDSLQNTYQDAHKKLSSGRGNLIRQTEKLKELGVKSDKSLKDKLITDGFEAE